MVVLLAEDRAPALEFIHKAGVDSPLVFRGVRGDEQRLPAALQRIAEEGRIVGFDFVGPIGLRAAGDRRAPRDPRTY